MNPTIIVAALLLTGMTAPAFGQVAQLQQLPNTTIPTQCIDLNQDRVCEAVVLANGTMINFTKPAPTPTPEKQIVLPPWCEGLTLSRCPPPGPLSVTQTAEQNVTEIKPTINQTAIEEAKEYEFLASCGGVMYEDEDGINHCGLEPEENDEECTGETFGNGEFQYCRPGENGYDPEDEGDSGSSDDNDNNNDEEDRSETSEEFRESQEDKGVGCQPEDDYCDYDEHCELTSVDCIDDRGFDEDDYNG